MVNDKIVGRQIRLNKVRLRLRKGQKYAELMFIGDCHFGSPQFDQPRFLAMLDFCLKHKVHVIHTQKLK